MGNSTQPNIRHAYIDQLKGISMILVIMGHILLFSGNLEQSPIIDTIVLINMPLFLFLNGLVVRKLTFVNGGGIYGKGFVNS